MSEPGPGQGLEVWGLRITAAYLALLLAGIPAALSMGWLTAGALSLNELGDFLAGAFGPLAIFWLVLGFFQQGQELRNSVATLELQARELAASVEQQRELVEVTREQLAHERALLVREDQERQRNLQPDFLLTFGPNMGFGDPPSRARYGASLTNAGAGVSRVELSLGEGDREILRRAWPVFAAGAREDTIRSQELSDRPLIREPLSARIRYVDNMGGPGVADYRLIPPEEKNGFGPFAVERVPPG